MSKKPVKSTNPELGSKNIQAPNSKPENTPNPATLSLLAALNPDRSCSCEVTARAVRADLPKCLGLTEKRAALEEQLEQNTDPKTIEDPNNPASSQTPDPNSLPPSK